MSCPATEKNVLVRLQSGEIVCFAIVRKKKKKEGRENVGVSSTNKILHFPRGKRSIMRGHYIF